MTDEEAKRIRDEAEKHKRDFSMCFDGPIGQRVLMYLSRFCHAAKSSITIDEGGVVDMHHTLINEGKRLVFLEIQSYLNLTPEQIFMLRFGVPYQIGDSTDE